MSTEDDVSAPAPMRLWGTPMGHEEAFIHAFVLPERQRRWTELLFNERRRSSFIHRLADPADLDPRWMVSIAPAEQTPDGIWALLDRHGAPEQCHLISEYTTLDGTDRPLVEALATIVGSGVGSVVSCLPGFLAYYEGEVRTRFLLHRP